MKEGVVTETVSQAKNVELSMNFLIEILCIVLEYYLAQVHFASV